MSFFPTGPGKPSSCDQPSSCGIGKPSECSHKPAVYPVQYEGEWVGDPAIQKVADPNHFRIQRTRQIGSCVIVEIVYPDCTNYDGRKILVYDDVSEKDIRTKTRLGPHFCKHPQCLSPIARFEPTKLGWEMAVTFCVEWGT